MALVKWGVSKDIYIPLGLSRAEYYWPRLIKLANFYWDSLSARHCVTNSILSHIIITTPFHEEESLIDSILQKKKLKIRLVHCLVNEWLHSGKQWAMRPNFLTPKPRLLTVTLFWPSVKMCMLTGAKCWTVQGVEMNYSSTELIQSTPNPKTHQSTLDGSTSAFPCLIFISFLFLPLFLSQLLICGFSLCQPQSNLASCG